MRNKLYVFCCLFLVSAQALASEATNPSNRLDVDNNGVVTEADARLVIRAISRHRGSGPIAAFSEYTNRNEYLDVNGDGMVEPRDAVQVLHELGFKRHRSANAGCNTRNSNRTRNQFGLYAVDVSVVDHKGRRVEGTFNGTVNLVKRYNPDGNTIDTSFGEAGIAASPDFPTFSAIDVTQENKILLVGFKMVQGKNERGYMVIKYQVTILLRLNEDGSVDTTFNPDGRFDKPLPLQDNFPSKPGFVYHPLYAPADYQGTRQDVYQFLTGTHIYADGTILVIGNAHFRNTDPFFSVYRHTGEQTQFGRFTHIGYAAPGLTNLSDERSDMGEFFHGIDRGEDCHATIMGVAAVDERGHQTRRFNITLRMVQDPITKRIGLDRSLGVNGFIFSPYTK